MKKLLLDSGIFSDYMHRRRNIYDRVRSYAIEGVRVGSCVPVVAELCLGIEASTSRDRNMRKLIGTLPTLTIWPFDQEAAFTYGKLAAELKRIGRPMQVVDIMVGAVALNLGNCVVATTDSDLAAIPGLNVEIW